eukprot:11812227-Prorocentrum_lima.AAC.1
MPTTFPGGLLRAKGECSVRDCSRHPQFREDLNLLVVGPVAPPLAVKAQRGSSSQTRVETAHL